MKLEWLGRYRGLIGALIKNGNLYSRASVKRNSYEYGIEITAMEWQVLETIYEHDDEALNMAQLASTLGIAQSNFSKYSASLCKLGLVEKFARSYNNKDIVLRPSEKGRMLYAARSAVMEKDYTKMFEHLDDIPDEYIEKFRDFLEAMNSNYMRYTDRTYAVNDELKKIE